MAQDASTLSRKRPQSPDTTEDFAAKRPKLSDDSTPPAAYAGLNAIATKISQVFGYNSQTIQNHSSPAQLPAPQNGFHPPAQTFNPAASPRPSSIPPPAATSPSPAKYRPAIKLAALRGTKWDDGTGPKSPSPKKTTPRRKAAGASSLQGTPTKATPTPNKGSPLKRASAVGDAESGDELSVAGRTPASAAKPAGAKRLFSASKASTPKSILTPKKRRGRPPKNVKFGSRLDDDDVFFEDVRKPGRPSKASKAAGDEDEGEGDIVCGICARGHSKAPNQIILCDNCDFAVHQECYEVPEIPTGEWLCKSCAQEDVLKTSKNLDDVAEVVKNVEVPDIPNLDKHVRALQRVLLDRCTGHRPLRIFGQQEAQDKARQLVEQTVVAGEGNSMLLIGARGSGKTTVSRSALDELLTKLTYMQLLEGILSDLKREHANDFHVVRLNGFIHTDDKLAVKEIWRQLGKEMEVDDDLINIVSLVAPLAPWASTDKMQNNYADTMTSLLALLSHPSEIMGTGDGVTSQSVVFIIDEFDMFAAHPRQTLLYNLFDVAQSRKAPISVLGCTTRLDVVEMLEKRVKSRFSHRYVYLHLPRSLPAYWQMCKQGLLVDKEDAELEGIDIELEGYEEFRNYWSHKIEVRLSSPAQLQHPIPNSKFLGAVQGKGIPRPAPISLLHVEVANCFLYRVDYGTRINISVGPHTYHPPSCIRGQHVSSTSRLTHAPPLDFIRTRSRSIDQRGSPRHHHPHGHRQLRHGI